VKPELVGDDAKLCCLGSCTAVVSLYDGLADPATSKYSGGAKARDRRAGFPGRANRVSFVMTRQSGRATRLVCRGTRTAQIFRQKSTALQCFFVARPGKSARASRHPCSPAEHTTLFSSKLAISIRNIDLNSVPSSCTSSSLSTGGFKGAKGAMAPKMPSTAKSRSPQTPYRGSAPGPSWGTSVPQIP